MREEAVIKTGSRVKGQGSRGMNNNRIKPASKCKIKPTQDELWRIASKAALLQKEIFPYIYKFINAHKNVPAQVMIEVLRAIIRHKPDDPWAYGVKITKIQMPNFYIAEHVKQHNEQKLFQSAGDILREIMEKGKHTP
jgi:hypothetical protein